jgi:hypothetical protein
MNTKSGSPEPLRLVHHHAGYFRAQADIFTEERKDGTAIQTARTLAESTPGFEEWVHSPKTGSFVIKYRPGTLDVDQLAEQIAEAVGLSGVVMDLHSSSHRKVLINGLLSSVEEINDIVYHATGKKADLRELIPAGLFVNSLVAFVLGDERGSRMPSWDSSLYRAYRIFMQTHKPEISKREKRRKKKQKKTKESESFEIMMRDL